MGCFYQVKNYMFLPILIDSGCFNLLIIFNLKCYPTKSTNLEEVALYSSSVYTLYSSFQFDRNVNQIIISMNFYKYFSDQICSVGVELSC